MDDHVETSDSGDLRTPVKRPQTPRWIIATAGIAAAGFLFYLLRGALMPFALALAIAYLLDPVADRLEATGLSRGIATLVILLCFFVILALAILTLVPLLGPQLVRLVEELPSYFRKMSDLFSPLINQVLSRLDGQQLNGIQEAATGYADVVAGWAVNLLQRVWAGGLAVIDLISLFVITPMVAFYLLRDFDKIVAKLGSLVPRPYSKLVNGLASESDHVLGRFVRGQALVALVLGVFYATALSIAGLRFGLAIGVLAGVINMIPFVGSLVGFVIAVSVAIAQYDHWVMWVVIASIFVFGQVVEGNFITPRLIGDAVGLHPVWIIFALLAGGNLFGITGVMLAVPAAAIIGVVVRRSILHYRQTHFFKGGGHE